MNGLPEDKLLDLLDLPPLNIQLMVEDKVRRCLYVAGRTFPQVRVDQMPTISYDLKGTTAAQAWQRRNHIQINLHLLKHNLNDMIDDTVPHEVAHLITHTVWPGAKAHSREWQHVMRILGLVPTRCHNYDNVKKARKHPRPYIYACECREWKITKLLHKRMEAGQRRICKRCHTQIFYERENTENEIQN